MQPFLFLLQVVQGEGAETSSVRSAGGQRTAVIQITISMLPSAEPSLSQDNRSSLVFLLTCTEQGHFLCSTDYVLALAK